MIRAESFVAAALERSFGLYTGVPCSYLTPLINFTINAPGLRYVGAANEGDAVAIAAGATLGGLRSVVMLQNSGLGNAVNPLTSLTHTFRIPILLIVTWRGEPGGAADEPQHELMGRITPALLDLMGIPWAAFPTAETDIAAALDRATSHMESTGRPFALLMRKDSVAPTVLDARAPTAQAARATVSPASAATDTRQAVLAAVQSATSGDDVVVATTGYTGRELYSLDDRPNQLYMVGSMGCASSLALGLALTRPERRVIALDGDGAALMRLGAMAIVGHERPPNLVHVLIDNGEHESTGGQATVSGSVDFCGIAAACGYPAVHSLAGAAAVGKVLAMRAPGLRFVHVRVLPGVASRLPRPTQTPAEVAERFRANLAGTAGAPA